LSTVFHGGIVFVSEALAIASACCIALSSMFLSELKGRVPVVQLARWQMMAGFTMTAIVSLALGGWHTIVLWQFGLLAASSLFGIAIASTTYFATIYAVGPRVTALLFSLTSPFALALGYMILGETIGIWQGFGVVLGLAGVVMAIGISASPRPIVTPATIPVNTSSAPPSTRRMWPGIALGTVTALGQAIGTLLARPVMASGVEPFTAMAVRSGLAAVLFIALAVTPFGKGSASAVRFGPMALALISALLGTTLGMSFLMAALHHGNVGVVSTLSSLTPVLILPMVWIRSGKRPGIFAWVGAMLAIAGTAVISMSR
jgi:drug/metabolite transporter (DMT)-like permease